MLPNRGKKKRVAEKSVSIALNEKKRKLTEIIESDSNKLNTKRGKWDNTSQIITDIEEKIEEKKEKLENINCLLSISCPMAKFSLAVRWASFSHTLELCGSWVY